MKRSAEAANLATIGKSGPSAGNRGVDEGLRKLIAYRQRAVPRDKLDHFQVPIGIKGRCGNQHE